MTAQCFMGYIFIVKYNVLFGLFNFGLGLGLLNLASASTSASRLWPRPRTRPQVFGLGLDLGLEVLALASTSASSIWPRLTSLFICHSRSSEMSRLGRVHLISCYRSAVTIALSLLFPTAGYSSKIAKFTYLN